MGEKERHSIAETARDLNKWSNSSERAWRVDKYNPHIFKIDSLIANSLDHSYGHDLEEKYWNARKERQTS